MPTRLIVPPPVRESVERSMTARNGYFFLSVDR
jgi:hypothetical protein